MSWTRAANASDIRGQGRYLIRRGKHQIVLFAVGETFHAVDNRCPTRATR